MALQNTHEEFLKQVKDVEHIIGEITIKEKYRGSKVKLLAETKYGEIFVAPSNLVHGTTPTILIATDKTQYFKNALKDKHPKLYDEIEIKGEYITAKSKILVSDKHGDCMVAPTDLLNGSRPSIKTAVDRHAYFLSMLKNANPTALKLEFVTKYSGHNTFLIVRDNYGDMKIKPSNLLCGKIPTIMSSTDKESYLTNVLREKSPNILKTIKVIKYYSSGKVLVLNKYGEVYANVASLIKGHNPMIECAKNPTEYWKKQAIEKHGDTYDYSKSTFVNSKTAVRVTCRKHGDFLQMPSVHVAMGCGCTMCSASKGEKMASSVLKKYNIQNTPQYTFEDCRNIKKLPFDFYLPESNTLLEIDGRQHTEIVNFGGISDERAMENLKATQFRDNIKNQYCKDNNIPLLRISYLDFDNIEEILIRELNL